MGHTSAVFIYLRRANQLKRGQCCIGFHSFWSLISWLIVSHKDAWLIVIHCGLCYNTARNSVLREAHILIALESSFYLAGLCVLDPTAALFCGSQEVKCASTSAFPSLPSLFLDTVQAVEHPSCVWSCKGCCFIRSDSCSYLCHGQVQLLFTLNQIAPACKEHCPRSRALISHGPSTPSLTVKGKHILCSWERRASTEALLDLVLPNKPGMCCVWIDWHMMCVPRCHCNKSVPICQQ